MKKTLSFMVMAFALLFAQCRKPEVKFPTPSAADEGTTVSMTVTAGPGSKTDITTAGGITWSSGDRLYVGDGTKYVGYLTLVSGSGTPTGTFSGDVTLTDASDGEKEFGFFYLGSGDYTSLAKGTSTTIDVDFSSQEIYAEDGKLKNASAQHVGYGTAKGTVSGGVVTGINVTLVSKVALARFSFKKGSTAYDGHLTLSGTNIYKDMTVNFGGTFAGKTTGGISLTGIHAERYVMLVPPASVAEEELNFGGGASGTTTLANGIEANKFYGRESAIEVEVTPFEFSVGEDGSGNPITVEFAPGNLQYIGSTGTWKFAEHQWDYLGSTTGQGSADENVDRDLFGWGCTGNQDTRAHTYQRNYMPYSTSTSTVNETYNKYGYGPDYDANKYNLSVENKSDWGCLKIGDDPAGTWRTLTSAEWKYLLDTRTVNGGTGEGKSYKRATINSDATGVYGMLLYPDGYTSQTGASSYTAEEFRTLEQAGVVFLPAAGYRDGTGLYSVGSVVYYWSSSCYSSSSAYYMFFSSSLVLPQSGYSRFSGYSVRLVR